MHALHTIRRKATIAAMIGFLALSASATAAVAQDDDVPFGNDANQKEFWEDYFEAEGFLDVECETVEPVDTPYIMPDAPDDKEWIALVIKAGSGEGSNEIIYDPDAGEPYDHSTKDNSHVIQCTGTESTPTSTPTPTPTPTMTPTPTPTPTMTPTPTPTPTVPPTGPVVETDIPADSGPSAALLGLGALAVLGLAGAGLRMAARRG